MVDINGQCSPFIRLCAFLCAGLFGFITTAASQIPPRQEKTVIDMSDEEFGKFYRNQLNSLKFDPSQDLLEPILKKAGENVAKFFRDFSNASAKEEVEKSKAYRLGVRYSFSEKLNLVEEYQYLILPGKTETSWIEDRTDKKNRPIKPETSQGFMMNSGYAGYSLYLHPGHQANSQFRYLGRETKKPQAHVIAFAQKLESGDYLGQFREDNTAIRFLVQGFLWVAPDNYQVLRMYTSMLAPERPMKLKETTTDIFYGRVVFENTGQEFWLPREIHVEWELPDCTYTNRHKYSNYHFFRVESDYKINPPALKK